jgi:O-antigen ligase
MKVMVFISFTLLSVLAIRAPGMAQMALAVGAAATLFSVRKQGRDVFPQLAFAAAVSFVYALVIALTNSFGAHADFAYLETLGFSAACAILLSAFATIESRMEVRSFSRIAITTTVLAGFALVVANSRGLLNYDGVRVLGLPLTWNIWIEKYCVYWLLLLVWGAVAVFDSRQSRQRFAVAGIFIFTFAALLLSGRSERAPFIFAVGVITYFTVRFALRVPNRWPEIYMAAISLLFLASPWVLHAVDLGRLQESTSERTLIYRASYALVMESPWIGHGFGSTLKLEHSILPDYTARRFPGGHPHNLALLFWLESGILGAVFISSLIGLIGYRALKLALENGSQAATAALISSFSVMIYFSWSIWYHEIILFYAMTVILLFYVARIKHKPEKPQA